MGATAKERRHNDIHSFIPTLEGSFDFLPWKAHVRELLNYEYLIHTITESVSHLETSAAPLKNRSNKANKKYSSNIICNPSLEPIPVATVSLAQGAP